MTTRYLSVPILLFLSWFFASIPEFFPSLLIPPYETLTTAQALAPPTLQYEIALRMPWASGWIGCVEVAEGLLLAAVVIALAPFVGRFLKREVSLPRRLRLAALSIIGLGVFFFWFFAVADFVQGPYVILVPLSNYPVLNAVVMWLKLSVHLHDPLGVGAFISLSLASIAFVIFRSNRRAGTVLRDGLLFLTALVALFELGLLEFVWTQMFNHIAYAAGWSARFVQGVRVAGTPKQVILYGNFPLLSNWTVLAFSWSLCVFGVVTLLASRLKHKTGGNEPITHKGNNG